MNRRQATILVPGTKLNITLDIFCLKTVLTALKEKVKFSFRLFQTRFINTLEINVVEPLHVLFILQKYLTCISMKSVCSKVQEVNDPKTRLSYITFLCLQLVIKVKYILKQKFWICTAKKNKKKQRYAS